MKIKDIVQEDTSSGETMRQAKKLGLMNGKPKLLHKTAAKNSDPNTLFNLGISESVDASALKPFVKFCIKKLELKSIPKIVITKKKLDGTFGYYDTGAKTLTVSSSDRHISDIMRTLAHELVHLAQDEHNQDIDSSDGSKHENQANAVAGVIMRKWADKDPSLFESEIQELKIEKPDPKDTLGVKRKDMPQVKSDDYAEFVEYLKSNGATFTKETIPARDLKAMQKEFSDEGIMKQLMKNIEQGPNRKAVIASSDDYIMDGHHRWLVAINTGADLNVFRVNLPAYELYDLVNKFEKTYYKDIYNERASIGVPFASGLVMKLFPHRPLKIAKSTPGKLNYNEVSSGQDSIGAQINFPGFEKTKVKPKPKYNPVPKKDKSILDKVKGWFTDDINEAYVLRLENDDDMLVLHIRDTKSGQRVEVRGKPNYEIDYDADDELHQLLDVIGKASNISDLMNGKIVNINPKHPDGPKSYAAIEKVMGEEWSAKYKRSINCDNPRGFSQRAHCAGRKKNEGAEAFNEAPTARDSMNLDADKLQQSIDYFYKDHAPKNFGSARNEGNFKGLKVVTFTKGNDTLMFLVNNDDQAVFYVMYSKFDDGVAIGNVRSNGTVKATEVYAYLVDKFGTLYSDDSQTPQGSKIWTSLAKFYPNIDVQDTGGRLVATKKTQVDEGVNDPHIFKAVFLAGGPGSGKS